MACLNGPDLDRLNVEPQLWRHGDTCRIKPGAGGGVIKAGPQHTAVARADDPELGRNVKKRMQRLHMVVPDPGFLIILPVILQDQPPAQGIRRSLVTGPSLLAKLAPGPGAPGPFQFPRRAFDIASV